MLNKVKALSLIPLQVKLPGFDQSYIFDNAIWQQDLLKSLKTRSNGSLMRQNSLQIFYIFALMHTVRSMLNKFVSLMALIIQGFNY